MTHAMQNDGTIDSGDTMIKWVRRQNPRQTLEWQRNNSRLLLSSQGESYDLYETCWLVFEGDKFVVLDAGEFAAKYEIKE